MVAVVVFIMQASFSYSNIQLSSLLKTNIAFQELAYGLHKNDIEVYKIYSLRVKKQSEMTINVKYI